MTDLKRKRAFAGIAALFIAAGAAAGFACGQMVTRQKAVQEVDSIRTAYAEADAARGQTLQMCLRLVPKAAVSAANAAEAARDAAQAAKQAAKGAEAAEQEAEKDK